MVVIFKFNPIFFPFISPYNKQFLLIISNFLAENWEKLLQFKTQSNIEIWKINTNSCGKSCINIVIADASA